MNVSGRISPNTSELQCCFVDDRRNLGDLLRCEVELRAEPFLHAPADQFRTMKRKEMMPRIRSSQERATNSPGDKHEDKCGNEFRSEEHTSELQSRGQLVCRLLLE